MTVLMIVRAIIHDESKLQAFAEKVEPIFRKHHGRLTLRRAKAKLAVGQRDYAGLDVRFTIAEFPSEQAIQNLLDDIGANPELKSLRQNFESEVWSVDPAA